MKLDYKVERSADCIRINTDDWVLSSDNQLKRYRISGRAVTTCITHVDDKNLSEEFFESEEVLEKGTKVLLSSIASEIARSRAYTIDNKRYYDIPVMQVLGYFEGNRGTLESFKLLYNKILIKKMNFNKKGSLYTVSDNSTVGKVIKVGIDKTDSHTHSSPFYLLTGSIVMLQDNVATEVEIEGETYLAVDISSVVGLFESENEMNIENLKVLNKNILMEEYRSSKLFDSSTLLAPNLNYEELDFSDIYNKDIFKVVALDEKLEGLEKGDIVLMDRNLTFYVYFNGNKYFLVNGKNNISGKLIQEGENYGK